MALSARSFPGGVATDNLVSGSALQGTQLVSAYFRFNITALDATTRRPFDWADATAAVFSLIVSNGGSFNVVSGQYATSAGNWTIAPLSTGAEHDILMTLDAGNVANVPTVFVDGSSVSITSTLAAPVGAFSALSKVVNVGNRADHTRCFNGWVSTVAIWTGVLLTSADATTLHNGTPPCFVETNFLVFYAPLDNGDSPEPEMIGLNNLTVTGSSVVTGSSTLAPSRCYPCGMGSM